MKAKNFLIIFVAVLLGCADAWAQSGGDEPLKGDVNGDGVVDVADIAAVIKIMKEGGGTVTVGGYFYLGTTQPTAENYKTLSDVVSNYTSIDDANEVTVTVSAGETLYMLCPTVWMKEKKAVIELNSGETINFSDEKDDVTIPEYTIYKTHVFNTSSTATLKTIPAEDEQPVVPVLVTVPFAMNFDMGSTFRGINNAVMTTFSQKDGLGALTDGKSLIAAATGEMMYDFGTIMGASSGNGSIPDSRRLLELSMFTGTNTMMFWGKAIKNGTDAQQGSIVYTVDRDLNNISFTLNSRVPDGNDAWGKTAYSQYQALLAKALSTIVQTQTSYNINFYGQNKSGTIKWSDYVKVVGTGSKAMLVTNTTDPSDSTGNTTMSPLGKILSDVFKTMTTINANEVRAGSGKAIAAMVCDLYRVMTSVANATPTSIGEAIAQQVAQAILINISNFFYCSGNFEWRNADAVKAAANWTPTSGYDLVSGDLNKFPSNFNVPAGAAVMQFDIYNGGNLSFTYSYKDNVSTYQMSGEQGGSFNISNYRYPAELCYFGNSPVRVSNDTHVAADYPDGSANWDNDNNWAGWTKDSHVLSTTRSVAMQQNINYGSASLKTTVRYGTATLSDNTHAFMPGEPNKSITVSAGLFELTGVLVSGVEPTVGWNYIVKSDDPKYDSYIYDNDLPSTAIPIDGSKSIPNYTLVWDNWNPNKKGQKQNEINIALEFVNHAGDFWGMNGLIRDGQTFYIIGSLNPDAGFSTSDRSDGITWPTTYALPPYASDGSTIKERRVFIQDCMTVANFVIGANSLRNAYVDVPDLYSSQISLGLSVDLEWLNGLNFE